MSSSTLPPSAPIKADTIGLETAADAKIAALTAVINRILVCNNSGLVFASNADKPDSDAKGYVSTRQHHHGDEEYELVEERLQVAVATPAPPTST